MIISFLINTSRNISKIVNFVNSMFSSFNIIPNLLNNSIPNTKKEILSNEIIIYEDDIIKESLINLIEEFPTL